MLRLAEEADNGVTVTLSLFKLGDKFLSRLQADCPEAPRGFRLMPKDFKSSFISNYFLKSATKY